MSKNVTATDIPELYVIQRFSKWSINLAVVETAYQSLNLSYNSTNHFHQDITKQEKFGSSHLSLMGNTKLNNVSMDSIEDLTAVSVPDDIIVNAINTIRKNKKQPEETSIYEFLNKNPENGNLTKIAVNERLTSMSKNNRITDKLTSGKKFVLCN